MTTNEIISNIYIMLEKKTSMSIEERCELQKLLKESLLRDIAEADKKNFTFHLNKFEEDIFDIVSKRKERCLMKLAQMQIAINRMTEEIRSI